MKGKKKTQKLNKRVISIVVLMLLGIFITMNLAKDTDAAAPFDYAEALDKSWLFYEAQRSGDTNDARYNTRVSWRVPSALNDGADVGLDLTGGWYDAGDHVKFGLPMASSATLLAWGVLEYDAAYVQSGVKPAALDSLRWVNDYFVKAHPEPNVFYAQVANGGMDHAWWGPPENMNMARPAYAVTASCPGSDVTGETAASLAAASIVFRSEGETAYADTLYSHAVDLYSFADTYRGTYNSCAGDVANFYSSSGYKDELMWAALWLHKATITTNPGYGDGYLADAEQLFAGDSTMQNAIGWTQNWDDKKYGSYVLLAQLTGKSIYTEDVENWLDNWLPSGGITYSPGGQAFLTRWGSLRYTATTAFIAMIYSDWLETTGGDQVKSDAYFDFGASQVNYILGDNPRNSSYMVGFGNNPPTRPHHRGSHASPNNNVYNPVEQTHVLYGALVGGPESADDVDLHLDDRNNYISNEVATDYNAGLTGALARMVAEYGGIAPTPLPATETPLPTATSDGNSTPPPPTSVCQVDYAVVNQWNNGFQADVVITNNGETAVSGWTLTWTHTAGQAVTSAWNATVSQSGNAVSASNTTGHWNGTIGANGGTVAFGIQGSLNAPLVIPTDFDLNGVACNETTPVTITPSPTNTQTPTVTATATTCFLPVILSVDKTTIQEGDMLNISINTNMYSNVTLYANGTAIASEFSSSGLVNFAIDTLPVGTIELKATAMEDTVPGCTGESNVVTVLVETGPTIPPTITPTPIPPTITPTPVTVTPTPTCPDSPVPSASLLANPSSVNVGDVIDLTFSTNLGVPQYTLYDSSYQLAVYQYGGDIVIQNESPVVEIVPGTTTPPQVRAIAPGTADLRINVSGETFGYQVYEGQCQMYWYFTGASSDFASVTVSDTPPPQGICQVNYAIANDWGSGFTTNVTINNTGTDPINGWELGFNFPGSQQISNAWNGSATQSGSAVTFTDVGWNGTIPPGGSQAFGFQGSYSGTNGVPTSFTVNGQACD